MMEQTILNHNESNANGIPFALACSNNNNVCIHITVLWAGFELTCASAEQTALERKTTEINIYCMLYEEVEATQQAMPTSVCCCPNSGIEYNVLYLCICVFHTAIAVHDRATCIIETHVCRHRNIYDRCVYNVRVHSGMVECTSSINARIFYYYVARCIRVTHITLINTT